MLVHATGAAPFVLDGTASLLLLRGDFATAERTAREALGYENRLLPTTRHRLARTLLLARASLDPSTPRHSTRNCCNWRGSRPGNARTTPSRC